MIIPSNVDIENHTADFMCTVHGGNVSGLNLNTDATYEANGEAIKVDG
jgi:hypothetical protein